MVVVVLVVVMFSHIVVFLCRPHSDQIDLLLNLLYGGRERRAVRYVNYNIPPPEITTK